MADFMGDDLRGTRFERVDLTGAEFRGVDLSGIVMRPTDPADFQEAWDIVERLWDGTVGRTRGLDRLLHESVDGEWSFIETLRHLVFATDAWVRRAILGDPSPWDPLDLPWGEMPDTPGIPRDREVGPPLDTVLTLRRDRPATAEELPAARVPVDRPRRGVAPPAVRRAGPRCTGGNGRPGDVTPGTPDATRLRCRTARAQPRRRPG